jgi:hypothetical protein
MDFFERLFGPLNAEQLKVLAQVAAEEREAFFARNPAQVQYYKKRFLGAALCQQSARRRWPIWNTSRDLDIHIFFKQHPEGKRLATVGRSRELSLPGLGRRRVTLSFVTVPERFARGANKDAVTALRRFLEDQTTPSAQKLAGRSLISIEPDATIGTVIWPTPTEENS